MRYCADCIHIKVCQKTRIMNPAYDRANECMEYKDRSLFVTLPCNVGDIVYEPVRGQISEFVVDSFGFDGEKVWLNLKCIKGFFLRNVVGVNDIGKSVFLSKIEAEKSSGFCKPTFTI